MANHLEIRTVHLKFPDQAFPVAKALPLWPHEFAPRDMYGSSPVVLDTLMRKPGQKKNSRIYSGRKLFHEKEFIVRAKLTTCFLNFSSLFRCPFSGYGPQIARKLELLFLLFSSTTHSFENLHQQPNSKETAANLALRNVHGDVSNKT